MTDGQMAWRKSVFINDIHITLASVPADPVYVHLHSSWYNGHLGTKWSKWNIKYLFLLSTNCYIGKQTRHMLVDIHKTMSVSIFMASAKYGQA